ncbi:hypothetical protein Dsin_003072 [Dipteronia sinensis]|uniref:Integrase zinc-binding domain-containing protein n=1 Tax=Dipteronia sinensis TaxID=43782 RepID=A0AAE0B6X7_9ROSI|nr:hypothetical protein Dsin_003072 [Dipteronia sinensis]
MTIPCSTSGEGIIKEQTHFRGWQPSNFWEFLGNSLLVAEWWASLQQEVIIDPYYVTLPSIRYPQSVQQDDVWVHFSWPIMRSVVKEFIHNCDICQRCKHDNLRPAGLLQSLPIPNKTKFLSSSSYHPQTDGQKKVVNLTSDEPKKWMDLLPWAEYSYNTTTHSATNTTPSKDVYEVPPLSLVSYIPGTTKVHAVDDFLCSREDILRELREHIFTAIDRMKSLAEQHHCDVTFDVGDYVYLRLQPY